jgi:hypothetical protein
VIHHLLIFHSASSSSVSDSSPSHLSLFFLRESQSRISTKHFQRMWSRITHTKKRLLARRIFQRMWSRTQRKKNKLLGICPPVEFTTLNDWFPYDFCQQGMKWKRSSKQLSSSPAGRWTLMLRKQSILQIPRWIQSDQWEGTRRPISVQKDWFRKRRLRPRSFSKENSKEQSGPGLLFNFI